MSIWHKPDGMRDMREWIGPSRPMADASLEQLGRERREKHAKDPAMAKIWNSALADAALAGDAAFARVMLQGGADPFWVSPEGRSAFEACWEINSPMVAEEMCRFGPYPAAIAPDVLERAARVAPFVAQELARWGAKPTPRALLNAVEVGASELVDDLLSHGADAAQAAQLAREDTKAAGAALSESIQKALARWESKTLGENTASLAPAKPKSRRPGL